jgi:8-oxo-dGTP pyrophosphatase MutT (NUDIX family)
VIREFSSGGLVIRNMSGRPHLAVVRLRDEILALPKGHPEKGESSQEAALREVREETGLDASRSRGSATSATGTRATATGCSRS